MWGCLGPAQAAQFSHLPWTRVCTPPVHSIPAAAAAGPGRECLQVWRGGTLASHSDCEASPALRAWGQGHEASCSAETHPAPSAVTPTPGSTAPFRHEAWLHCGRPVWAARMPAVLWPWVETSMGPKHRCGPLSWAALASGFIPLLCQPGSPLVVASAVSRPQPVLVAASPSPA